MSVINILAGPIIGSLIGYVTNYIAVKMLFRPLRPIMIGNLRLPFTPGIFPKRKEQLAKALGKAVGNNLLTCEDIENMFLAAEVKEKIISQVCSFLSAEKEQTLKKILENYCQEETYLNGKEQLEKWICEKIISGISQLDLGEIISRESARAIKDKTQGTPLSFIANDKLIISLAAPIGAKVQAYIESNGFNTIRPLVHKELETLENRPISDLVAEMGFRKEQLFEGVDKIYTYFIREKVAEFIKEFDIAGVVEEKVKAMDVLEIEQLVLSVMKRELNAVINLGALIGLIIGTINIFI
ncbi:MAG TPA: DUF445 family protein [Peptococcaceae bacterium]|nr:DUF445 family protein [Peptococcaceae bacterium]